MFWPPNVEGVLRNLLIADAPEAPADALVRVLRDPALGNALRENGRQWVEERYDWRRAYH